MPELPEVETVKNSLKELVLGKRIIRVEVFYERIIQNVTPLEFKTLLAGERFCQIERRGKFLIFVFDHLIMVSHLRMEGKYFLKGNEEKEKHEHIIFYLENDESLRYNDTRKFGVMYLFKTTNIEEVEKMEPLNSLGWEPFDNRLTVEYLKGKWSHSHKPLKTALLDQSVICGLGNIYADEVCFMSKLNPLTDVSLIGDEKLLQIINNSQIVLQKAISLGGTTIRSFVNSHAATGLFQNELLVHTKKICPTCSQEIIKIYVGGRGTYYCPKCQKNNLDK